MATKNVAKALWQQKMLPKLEWIQWADILSETRSEEAAMYAALLADMKNSKKYASANRIALQNYLDVALSALNRMFRGAIAKEVGFSGGDEIQGLFSDPISAYQYFRLLSLTLGVGVFRCGIGVGRWDVQLEDRSESAAQDGEAYHLAREAIGDAARSDYYDLVCRSRRSSDDSMTVLLDHSWGQCKMRTDTQNEMALLTSLFYPLVFERASTYTSSDEYQQHAFILLRLFEDRCYTRHKESSVVREVLSRSNTSAISVRPCEGRCLLGVGGARNDTLVGAARDIALWAKMSHQGIGRKISQGRLVQERCAIANAHAAFSKGRLA